MKPPQPHPASWILSGFCDEASVVPAEQVAVAKRAGLSHMDVRIVHGRNISDLAADEAKPVAELIRAAGLRVGCLGSAIGKTDLLDDFAVDQARLERLAGHADLFGCRSVRVFSTFNKSGRPASEWRSVATERLQALHTRAGALGLTLLIENERHLYGDRLEQVLDLAESTGIGLIFDFDNFHQSCDDPWTNWQALKPFVRAFHLKDSDQSNVHVPFGSGAGRAREILADALADGWDGLLSLEPHLARSAAVVATGPHGRGSQEGNDPVEAFLLGAAESKKFLTSIGVAFQ